MGQVDNLYHFFQALGPAVGKSIGYLGEPQATGWLRKHLL